MKKQSSYFININKVQNVNKIGIPLQLLVFSHQFYANFSKAWLLQSIKIKVTELILDNHNNKAETKSNIFVKNMRNY